MRAVNLLPRDAGRQRRVTQQNLPVVVGAGLGVVVTGALALTFLSAASSVKSAQQQLDDVTAQLAATPKPASPTPAPNAQLAGEQSARVTAVSTALGGRVAWDRILREFSLVLPDDVWVSSLGLSPDNGLTISGTTYSHESVARLLSRLALIPELSDIVLSSSTAESNGDGTPSSGPSGPVTVSFGVTASVALPASAAPVVPPPVPAPTTTDTTSTGATS
jgi:Tfp pilus assembly protein PilN